MRWGGGVGQDKGEGGSSFNSTEVRAGLRKSRGAGLRGVGGEEASEDRSRGFGEEGGRGVGEGEGCRLRGTG